MTAALTITGIIILAGAILCLVAVLCAPSIDDMDTDRL